MLFWDSKQYWTKTLVAWPKMFINRYRFRNLSSNEVADDLDRFLLKLQGVNPKARVILTVVDTPNDRGRDGSQL